jgi:alkanesulfonate monooxygenase SsuD/methylene tetrahydromethanopterin reductase-like flavin-dependent oxidoreductase (luciferase family)
MRTYYFSECSYPYLPEGLDSTRVSIPNRYFDPTIGADLYNRYLDEWQLADELGLDVMVNEHHSTAININPCVSVVAATLARITKRAKILILGNPIANRRDPVRVAEEMAMIDNYSRGRLEVGFVRGVPTEISPANSLPVRTVDRFWEAHDLIKKAWTSHDGPFNWEGTHFNYRQVNIWPRPYQQPHPPIWIPAYSPEQVRNTAERGYTVATFLADITKTAGVFGHYRQRCVELGIAVDEARMAFCGIVAVGKTDEEGLRLAEKINWLNTANITPVQFRNPPGYNALEASVTMLRQSIAPAARNISMEAAIEKGFVFAGSPESVFKQIKRQYEAVGGYGNLIALGQGGFMDREETASSLRLFAAEVLPRLQELKPEAIPA